MQQVKCINYYETYSLVVQWSSVRQTLIPSIIQGWASRQVDFAMAFLQANITQNNYMKLPKGIKTTHGDGNTHVLKIKKNLYGGKNAGKKWFNYLKEGLENIGFTQSQVDNGVFYQKGVIFLCFTWMTAYSWQRRKGDRQDN